jgi:hypothetical protein
MNRTRHTCDAGLIASGRQWLSLLQDMSFSIDILQDMHNRHIGFGTIASQTMGRWFRLSTARLQLAIKSLVRVVEMVYERHELVPPERGLLVVLVTFTMREDGRANMIRMVQANK